MKKENFFDSIYIVIILFLFQIYFGILPGWKKITSDFPNYYVSSKLLSEHKDVSALYNNDLFNRKIKEYGIDAEGQFALYPPPDALLFLPLTPFEPLTAKRTWLIVNIFLIIACGFLIKEITQWNFISSINVVFLTGFALANDLFLGQVYLFCTVLLLTGYLFLKRNKNSFASLSWGVVMALKYLPVIFLPVLLVKRKWKMISATLAIFVAIHLVCISFFGIEGYTKFFNNIFISHIKGNLYEGKPYSIKYQSWESLLNNLFIYDVHVNPHPVFNFPAGKAILKFLIYASVLSTLIFFYVKTKNSTYFIEIIISISVISLLVFEPGSATYHNLFLILPFILIMKFLIPAHPLSHLYFSILFLLIGFLPSFLNKFDLFNGGNIFLSYNRLWLEMIFYFYSIYLIYDFSRKNSGEVSPG
ncbi:MAG: glycosyltransferase family 87 protein [Bacteroidia bacterium]